MTSKSKQVRAFASSEGAKTVAQWFAYLVGLVLVAVGLIGFAYDSDFTTGQGISGDEIFGVFEVNGFHNVVHIASGLLLLLLAPKRVTARYGVIAFGVVYGLVTLIGLIDGEDVLGLLPVNPADNVLHVALTIGALLAGLVSPTDDVRDVSRGSGAATRR